MKQSLFLLFAVYALNLNAKELPKYPVSTIREELKKDMYAVVRKEEVKIHINSTSSLTRYYYLAVTILNPNGKRLAQLGIYYDKLTSIKSIKASIYDAAGSEIKKIKNSEFQDMSAVDGGTMFSDDRYKFIDVTQNTYPYTVEFEYEVEEKKLYEIPDFFLYDDDEVSYEKNCFSIIYSNGLRPRYKLYNNIKEPKEYSIGDNQCLEWSFENFRPEKFEQLSDYYSYVPHVAVSPAKFDFDGYAGDMSSWESIGMWQMLLNKDRDQLSEATKKKVIELTSRYSSVREKAKVIYEYLQSKTRYVGIQLGIGGFQPFPADVVDKYGYGDCKGLSNYMVSLLKVAGIRGYYTYVSAGAIPESFDATFPSDYGNHIIVSIPTEKDTIWLECTSQTLPFDYLGTFTNDRTAIMITDDGGKIVKTHRYPAEVNVQKRSAHVTINALGDATAKVSTQYSGLKFDNGPMLESGTDKQKDWILETTQIPSFDLLSFKLKHIKDKIPSTIVELDLSLRKFASVSGKRLFLTPNLMNRSTFIPEKLDQRKTNVVLRTPYIDIDTIRYHVPEEIYPEFLPEPVVIKSVFGEYEARYIVDQGSIVYIRRMKRNKGEFAPETYNDLINFYRAINKADNTKIVFLTKT